eukprot:14737626-Alexandrium_andersonii.AAC.1
MHPCRTSRGRNVWLENIETRSGHDEANAYGNDTPPKRIGGARMSRSSQKVKQNSNAAIPVSYTHLRAHETSAHL